MLDIELNATYYYLNVFLYYYHQLLAAIILENIEVIVVLVAEITFQEYEYMCSQIESKECVLCIIAPKKIIFHDLLLHKK